MQIAINTYHTRVDEHLRRSLSHNSIEPQLQNAMRYALFNGGKRVRPLLVYLVNQLLNGEIDKADAPASAIECIHSYSLVHDDLPAMDDDELRRGQPTCHIAFDEATAILAGDALQCFAFELLTETPSSAEIRLQMISVLAKASGNRGMVAGQAFDLCHVDKPLTLIQLEQMHRHKTGALINAAIELGYHSAECQDVAIKTALIAYGDAIGLAFQVKDDILDIESDTQTLGKPQGSDLDQNKPTYPALLGMDGAKSKLEQLHQAALDALLPFSTQGKLLRELADYIVTRSY
nr:farnesyl diphosphate synthase [Neptunomonas antarctica]